MPVPIRFADGSYAHFGHFMLFLGGLVAVILVAIDMKRTGESPEKIYGLLILLMISSVYGAHILYWLDFREQHDYGLLQLLMFWKGGMALYGGCLLALVTFLLYMRWQRLDAWRIADLLTPPAAMFVFCARIGCYLSGCCYGKQCDPDFPLALTLSGPSALAPKDIPVYPTQLYFAASAFVLFGILWARRKRKGFEGEICLIGILLYSPISFLIEFFRGDLQVHYQIFGTTLSQNQIISVGIFLVSSILYFYLRGVSRLCGRNASGLRT